MLTDMFQVYSKLDKSQDEWKFSSYENLPKSM